MRSRVLRPPTPPRGGRGSGEYVVYRLIEAVYAFADGFGPASVYWLIREYNAPARSLYDTLAHRTSFVVYHAELQVASAR
jgi:hypothetical protein